VRFSQQKNKEGVPVKIPAATRNFACAFLCMHMSLAILLVALPRIHHVRQTYGLWILLALQVLTFVVGAVHAITLARIERGFSWPIVSLIHLVCLLATMTSLTLLFHSPVRM